MYLFFLKCLFINIAIKVMFERPMYMAREGINNSIEVKVIATSGTTFPYVVNIDMQMLPMMIPAAVCKLGD